MGLATPVGSDQGRLALRLARAMVEQEGRAAGSILRKVGWWLLIGLPDAALALAVIADGRRQRDPGVLPDNEAKG